MHFKSLSFQLYRWDVFLIFLGVIFIFLGAWPMDSGVSVFSYIFGYLYDSLGSDLVGGIVLLAVVALVIRYVTKTQEGSE